MRHTQSIRKFQAHCIGDNMNRLAALIVSTRNRRAKLDVIKLYREQSRKLNLLIN